MSFPLFVCLFVFVIVFCALLTSFSWLERVGNDGKGNETHKVTHQFPLTLLDVEEKGKVTHFKAPTLSLQCQLKSPNNRAANTLRRKVLEAKEALNVNVRGPFLLFFHPRRQPGGDIDILVFRLSLSLVGCVRAQPPQDPARRLPEG